MIEAISDLKMVATVFVFICLLALVSGGPSEGCGASMASNGIPQPGHNQRFSIQACLKKVLIREQVWNMQNYCLRKWHESSWIICISRIFRRIGLIIQTLSIIWEKSCILMFLIDMMSGIRSRSRRGDKRLYSPSAKKLWSK